jgi:elongation factor P--(R)-beta-lysine ligase
MLSASDLRKGLKVQIDGSPYIVTEFEFSKPGKGQALYRCKMRNMISGNQLVKTYRSNDKFEKAELDERNMQFLYNQGEEFHFMDTDNYEQLSLTKEQMGDNIHFLLENMDVVVLFFDSKPIDISIPTFVNLVVTRADPWAKGDTSGNDTKPVTVQTGYELQVPPFVEEGDKIQIDTRTGEYVTRVKSKILLSIEGLHFRAAFFRFIRSFFHEQGFLEVDTPLRQPVCLPESNIIPIIAEDQYLQTSPELCMKRLLAHGCDKIFQLSHCFRKDERGRLHLEEFQMLEWYRVGCDYCQLMVDCENLLRFLLEAMQNFASLCGKPGTQKIFPDINIEPPWQRLTVAEAFVRFSPVSLCQALETGSFDEILTEYVEPQLGLDSPAFLYDYPEQLASLARKSPSNQSIAERFELYIQGVEIANGFSELTDEREQRSRFQKEIAVIHSTTGRSVAMPERFLEDIGRLGTAAGIALGIDRLFMLAKGYKNIAEAVTFAPSDFV